MPLSCHRTEAPRRTDTDNPDSGEFFTIRVTHKGTLKDDEDMMASQPVAILISGQIADPAPALRVLDVSMTGEDLQTISWVSVVGATYQLETTTDLSNGPWVEVPGEYLATKEVTSVEVASESTDPHRFWRVRTLP